MFNPDDLVTWLRAQLDADEHTARGWLNDLALYGPFEWDPSEVLAEVASKRRILDHVEAAHRMAKIGPSAGDGAWFLVTRLLAERYADRAGYREEWRP